MKSALISGITGQDGAYLAKFLLRKGYKVFGTYRRLSTPNFWRLKYLGIYDKTDLIPIDLADHSSLIEAIKIAEPDEIYHLAAQSFVEASFQTPYSTGLITGLSTTSFLEAVRQIKLDAKFYFAATSELYGFSSTDDSSLNENHQFKPMSPYAAAKLYSYWINKIYREGYRMFASAGILFNHESPLRGLEFVTRKIVNSLARIKFGLSKELAMGNLEARRDWGYAPEYVEAMYQILNCDRPDDFVIATNETHSVREFLELAGSMMNLNYADYLRIDKSLMRPLDLPSLKGDYSKAKEILGWEPKTDFKELVRIMVNEEVRNMERLIKGELFPWDTQLYNEEVEEVMKGVSNGK